MKKIVEQFRYLIIATLFLGPLLYAHAAQNGPSAQMERLLAGNALHLQNAAQVKSFYQKRDYEPAWRLNESNAAQTVKDFVNFIRSELNDNGLSENNYALATLQAKVQSGSEDDLLAADIMATDTVLHIAHSFAGEDPSPSTKMEAWPIRRARLDLVNGLNEAVKDRDVSAYLQALLPRTPKYERLKQALAEYRAIADKGGWIKLPPRGTTLHPGDRDDRIPIVQQRLAQEGYMEFDASRYQNPIYDDQLAEAVKQFQDVHGLNPDAALGQETFRAFNVSTKDRIMQIRVNMARMRQSPNSTWENIVVNIPSARISYFRNGAQVYEAPVVVGRIDRPTPLVASEIYEMIINPSWYVPRSIAEKDILPKLKEDPEYLESMGISLRGDETAGDIAARLKQKPGPGNSLGRLKFNFQNPYAIYLHGTPHVELFDRDDRNRSSGCIRLQKPEELAMIFLKDEPQWTPDVLRQKIDSLKTTTVKAPQRVPIKVLYWTVLVDDQNRVHFYNDVYGLDREWAGFL